MWDWSDVWNRIKLITDLVGEGKRHARDDTIQKILLSGQWVIYTKDTACHSDPYALNPFYVNSDVKLPTTIEYRNFDGLPQLDVRDILPPPFTGDLRTYRSFRDQFISAVHSNGFVIPDAQRLGLLRPLLQGNAAIQPCTATAYDTASLYHLTTAILAYHYEVRPGIVHTLLFNDLLAIPATTNCVAEIRTLCKKLLAVFREMLYWGFDHRAHQLDWYLQAKLPLAASTTILRKKSTLPNWDSFAFFDALEEMLDLYDEAVSLLGYGMSAASEGIPSRLGETHRSTPQSDIFTDPEPPLVKPGPRCSYCTTTTKNAHWSSHCPQFSTVRSRHKRAKALQLCYVCLRRGHNAGHLNCRALLTRLCAYCQRQRHHKSLCSTYLNRVLSTRSGRRSVRHDVPRRSRRRHRIIPGLDAEAEAFRKQNGRTPTDTKAKQGRQSARSSTIEGKVEASSTVRSEDRSTTSSTTPTRRTTGHQRSQAVRGAKDHEDPAKRPPSTSSTIRRSIIMPMTSSRRNSAARRDGTSKQPTPESPVAKPYRAVTLSRRVRRRTDKTVIRQTSTIFAKHAPSPQEPSMRGDLGADHDEDQKSPIWTDPRSTAADDASLREGALATGSAATGNCPPHLLKCVQADVFFPAHGHSPTPTRALLCFDSSRRRSYISDRLARRLHLIPPSTTGSMSGATAATSSRACAPIAASVAAPGRTLRTPLTIQLAHGPAVTIPVSALPTDAHSVKTADYDNRNLSEFRQGSSSSTPGEACPDVFIGRGHHLLFGKRTSTAPIPSVRSLAHSARAVDDCHNIDGPTHSEAELQAYFEAHYAHRFRNDAVYCASVYNCEPIMASDGTPFDPSPESIDAQCTVPVTAPPRSSSNGIPCVPDSGFYDASSMNHAAQPPSTTIGRDYADDNPPRKPAFTPVPAPCLRSDVPDDDNGSFVFLAALRHYQPLPLPFSSSAAPTRSPLGTNDSPPCRRARLHPQPALGLLHNRPTPFLPHAMRDPVLEIPEIGPLAAPRLVIRITSHARFTMAIRVPATTTLDALAATCSTLPTATIRLVDAHDLGTAKGWLFYDVSTSFRMWSGGIPPAPHAAPHPATPGYANPGTLFSVDERHFGVDERNACT